jgi:hypothetical protein
MNEIPYKIRDALKKWGYSEAKIDGLSATSLIVQDLGIWGDDFDEFYEVLSETYGTKNKIEARYCPGEFSWMRQVLLWLPFVSHKKNLACEPLSLGELDRIMSAED